MPIPILAQIAASLLAAVVILVREAASRGKIPLLVIAVALLVADAGLTFWNQYSQSRAEHCSQYSGVLRSAVQAVGNQVLLRSGGDIPATTASPPGKELRMSLGGDTIRLRLVDQRPVVTFPFRDSNGDVIGYIKDNEWHVSTHRSYEHNFNENTLEVVGDKGEILLQLELLGEVVRVAGTFYTPTGEGKAVFRPSLGAGRTPDGRLFRYPSCMHPAELQE